MKNNNNSSEVISEKIFKLVDEFFELKEKQEEIKNFPLVVPSYGAEEVKESINSLLTTYVTMGKKCQQFENDFAKYLGVKHGLFVNSGSTANLIALSILSSPNLKDPIKPGDEIITPAVTWSTTVFPIYDINAVPVFIDIDPNNFTINIEQLKLAITEKTKAIMPVHLLGNPCDMKAIMEIAEEHSLYVIEDCCEAHGAKIGNRMVGSFGHLSTFSFFFSHHISTIEGGLVLSNNSEFIDIGKSLRAHGWIRERSDKKAIEKNYANRDSRFLFIHKGYNVRPTEIQGAFGIHQLPKLEGFVNARIEAARYLIKNLSKYSEQLILPKFLKDTRQSWFGFSIVVKENANFTKKELSNYLEEHGIETRPIMGGNFVEQPVMQSLPHKTVSSLENSKLVFQNGLFIGLHHKLDNKKLAQIIKIFDKFFSEL